MSKLMIKKPGTIWITGLAASGKTTLAKKLTQELSQLGIQDVVVLDGEEVRKQLEEFGYLTEDRNAIGVKKAQLALDYNKKGKHVIITGIAHHRATRDQVRKMFERYAEVYLDCPVEVCARRDYKGHYERAFRGEYKNFIGVTEPYQKSEHPELILETSRKSLEQCVKALLEFTLNFIGHQKSNPRKDEESEKAETVIR